MVKNCLHWLVPHLSVIDVEQFCIEWQKPNKSADFQKQNKKKLSVKVQVVTIARFSKMQDYLIRKKNEDAVIL